MTEKKGNGKKLVQSTARISMGRRSSQGNSKMSEKIYDSRNAAIEEISNLRALNNTVHKGELKNEENLFMHTQIDDNPTMATSKMLTSNAASINGENERTVKGSEAMIGEDL